MIKRISIFAVAILAGCATATAISNDIATACSDALPVVNAAAPIVSADPTGALIVGSIQGACTANGMAQLTINDTKPVTPTNSGASAIWVATSTDVVRALVAKLKPATIAPVAK
jgi:hypothetical protein